MVSVVKSGVFFFLLINQVFGKFLPENLIFGNLSNERIDEVIQEDCGCDWRYFKHYEAKGCRVLQTNSCGCPISYSCSSVRQSASHAEVCMYQNKEYKIGEKISLTDNCKVCRCYGTPTAHISCRQRECPQLEFVEGENCHLVYDENSCCPSRYECVGNVAGDIAESAAITCTYDNTTYPLGAKIYPPDDPCLICECTESWDGISNSSCYQQECVFEKNKHLLDLGCIPIYHENKCCPIEYYCAESYGLKNVESVELSLENSTENISESCVFAGNSYEIGSELPLNRSCVKCKCQVPPDFTCIHQSCPPPPNAENCIKIKVADQCCATYDCLLGDAVDGETTENSTTEEDICPTPLCADDSCRIEIPEGHQCPTCVCEESREKNIFEPVGQMLEQQHEENSDELQNAIEDDRLKYTLNNSSEKDLSSETFIEKLSHFKFDDEDQFEEIQPEMLNPETLQEDENSSPEDFMQLKYDGGDDAEGLENHIDEFRQKRSENLQLVSEQSPQSQQQWNVLQQDPLDESESSEKELESSEESNEGFDELKRFVSTENDLENSENREIRWIDEVPGCPTPLCENRSCRIGVPPGQRCPTCICNTNRQL
ncbi:VWFC domain-containing protein [Caerostris extrusa]|uniref:VWFC domain-containing protein n=1 Tax=Caerostris extrusa TaxID=172846 RepID=A0AAV4WP66_CAEEX|nr:VWFC domain-containing protein [Caerostris extrusa]